MKDDVKELRMQIIEAGLEAVAELILIAREKILKTFTGDENAELSADRLKNAAATKKLAIFDALEILNKVEEERENIESINNGPSRVDNKQGFAERNAK